MWITYVDSSSHVVKLTSAPLSQNGASNLSPAIVVGAGNYPAITAGPSGQALVADLAADGIAVTLITANPVAPAGSLVVATPNIESSGIGVVYATKNIDSGPSIVWDANARFGPNGRVFLAYTDSSTVSDPATYSVLMYSDDGGLDWKDGANVTPGDSPGSSQFDPSLAVTQCPETWLLAGTTRALIRKTTK